MDVLLKKLLITGILSACLFLHTTEAKGQIYEAGILTGSSFYSGDLRQFMSPGDLFQDNRLAGGVMLRYSHNRHLAARLTMLAGHIEGNQENSPFIIDDLSYSFETLLIESSIQGEVNFLPFLPGNTDTRFTPYIFGGAGALYYSRDDYDAFTAGYLLGTGFKLNLSSRLTTGVEWGMRRTRSDNLDYAMELTIPGNPKRNDWYSFAGISLSYKFLDRSQAVCPFHNY